MITKTYLDGKLDQLEGRVERKIDFKIAQAVQKRESEVTKLKNDLVVLEEKKVDGKLVDEIESLRARVEELEKIISERLDAGIKEDEIERSVKSPESDVITPDEI